MADPKGNLVVPVAFRSDGSLHALELDDDDQLKVAAIVRAQDGDKIFSLASIVEEQIADAALGAGSNDVDGTAVPAGKIHVITAISIVLIGTAPTLYLVSAVGLASGTVLYHKLSPTASAWDTAAGTWLLQAGDFIRATVAGATGGDTLICRYSGYAMNAP